MKTQEATNSANPSWNTFRRPKTSPSDPEVTITAAPISPDRSRLGGLIGV